MLCCDSGDATTKDAAGCLEADRAPGPVQAQVDFQLSEQLYARACVRQPESVALWLGADVMLEFPLGEAAALLVRLENPDPIDKPKPPQNCV